MERGGGGGGGGGGSFVQCGPFEQKSSACSLTSELACDILCDKSISPIGDLNLPMALGDGFGPVKMFYFMLHKPGSIER